MRSFALVFIAIASLSASVPAFATYCPPLPAQSPIPAPTPDDIPRAKDAWLFDHQGNYFEGQQNHVMAFVQTGPDEQKVWFSINSVPHYTKVFYNRRFRTSSTAPWQWAYSRSVPVVWFTSPGSMVVNAVLYSPTAKYRVGTASYKYVMYATYQPRSCDLTLLGFAMVSFSNDGTCWTQPEPMRTGDERPASCASAEYGTDLLWTESFDVIDAGTFVLLVGVDGDTPTMINPANMDQTFGFWGYSNLPDMRKAYMPGYGVSRLGIVNPQGVPNSSRSRPYAYLINPAIAWDEANGDLYLTRAYPYPYDREGALVPSQRQQFPKRTMVNPFLQAAGDPMPQEVEGCVGGAGTLPNRVQIYKMHIGALTYANFIRVSTDTWTLVQDLGNNVGYEWEPTQQNIAIVPPQTSVGRDLGAASFLRDGAGRLQLVGGTAYMFAATQYLKPLSVGPCRSTGTERSFLTVVPR